MALGKDYELQDCPIARTLELVGERWTILVIRDCFLGVRRFTDFLAHLDIPRAVLANRLDRLVTEGMLERREYRPGRNEYLLTDRGLSLWPILHSLAEWGDQQAAPAPVAAASSLMPSAALISTLPAHAPHAESFLSQATSRSDRGPEPSWRYATTA